jgi:ribonuclease HI
MGEITRDSFISSGTVATIHCDGSCPTNPGAMGIGFNIKFNDQHENEEDIAIGYRLGVGTNNQAEYLALIAALRECLRHGVLHAQVWSDSQLMVNQVNGQWKVRDGRLKPLLEEAQGLVRMFITLELRHIHREDNADADYLSKNPTAATPEDTEQDGTITPFVKKKAPRKLTRTQAALIRWWWKTRRCQNEYRLARIFSGTPSHMGRVGRGDQYKDITSDDLPKEVTNAVRAVRSPVEFLDVPSHSR